MKKVAKKLLAMVITLALVFVPFINVQADELPTPVEVGTQEELVGALANTEVEYIKLTADIELTQPLSTDRIVTLDGAGFTLDGTNIVPGPADGSNKSIITALPGAELSLININLVNAPKYGAQAYDGGGILFNKVTIQDCKYGAVLVNGGLIVIQDLTMIRNGNFENGNTGNGIELGKGAAVTENPNIIMDGKFTVQDQETVLWIAENDKLVNEEDSMIYFGYTETTEFTLEIVDNALVVKDANGEEVAASNAILDLISVDENVPADPEPTPEPNPETSDNIVLFVSLTVLALGLGTVTFRKLCK